MAKEFPTGRDVVGVYMDEVLNLHRPFDHADRLMAELDKAGLIIVERPPDHTPATGFLVRAEDVTGLSGTGRVAWIVEFPDGKCVVRWCVSDVRQTAVFDSIKDVLAVHGHDGRTKPEWPEAMNCGEWPALEGVTVDE